MAEIAEGAQILGFDLKSPEDAARFIGAIEASLDSASELVDAKVLGTNQGTAWSNRDEDPHARSIAQPELRGTELGPQLEQLRDAYAELDHAYNGVYEGLLADRERALAAEGAGVTAQIQSIENTIAFWTGMAGSTSSAISNVNKGMAAGHKIERHYASGAAAGKAATKDAMNAAHHADQEQGDVHAGTDVTAKAQAAENNQEYWGGGKASRRADRQPLAPVVHAPTQIPSFSVGGFVDLAMKLWSDEKLLGLRQRLDGLERATAANTATIQMVRAKSALDRFEQAKRRVSELTNDLGHHQLVIRQQQLANLGRDLDSYADEHRGELARKKSFTAPRPGHEAFGTLMSLVGKIEQYRALSSLALSTFGYDAFIREARTQQLERARVKRPFESANRDSDAAHDPPPPVALMTSEETKLYRQIGGTYLEVLQQDAHWQVRLSQITPRFEALMKKLTGRDRVPHTEGQRF